MSKLKSTKTSIETDIVRLCDSFTEFNDNCSFLFDSFASLAVEEDFLDSSTAMGISRYSHWLKRRAQVLKNDLQKIHEKAYTQRQNT